MSVAIITGAGQGIGRAIAIAMSLRDSRVIIADVNGPAAAQVQKDLQIAGEIALALEVNVADELQ